MEEALIGLAGAVVGAVIVAAVNYFTHRKDVATKMVEVAVGILSQEPDQKTAALRDWAVDTLAHYSGDVPLTDAAKESLRSKPLPHYVEAAGEAHLTLEGARRIVEILNQARD